MRIWPDMTGHGRICRIWPDTPDMPVPVSAIKCVRGFSFVFGISPGPVREHKSKHVGLHPQLPGVMEVVIVALPGNVFYKDFCMGSPDFLDCDLIEIKKDFLNFWFQVTAPE